MRLSTDFIRCLFFWLTFAGTGCLSEAPVEDSKFWLELGKTTIREALQPRKIHGIAKNVILFVGDGMGMTTITAARIFKGQLEGRPGEEGYLTFEKFPHVALVKTYNVDRQVPDSAGTATALFSGIKGNYYTVGLDSHGKFNVCNPEVEQKAKVTTMIDWAISAGKSTGLVTTTRVTHATPAAAYGRSAHRDWECDSKIPEGERNKGCKDIGRQLVEDEPGKNINIVLGGGAQVLRHWLNDTTACTRRDSKDLVWDWMQTQKQMNRKYKFVQDKEQLMAADNDTYILGLFAHSHMPYDKDRSLDANGHPSLSEMVSKALDVVKQNDKGFLLIVEGGRIDHANHDNLAKIAMEETVAFDLAIETALRKVNVQDTLIVVTADHSHSMSINGYPKRGNPIEGVGDVTPEGFAYQTLSYINGPGYDFHRVLSNLSDANDTLKSVNTWKNLNETDKSVLLDRNQPHHAGYWMDYETHGGEDVPVYAIGPMAHLLFGVHEQTHVPFTIAYSLCIGPYAKNCRSEEPPSHPATVSAAASDYYYYSTDQFLVLITTLSMHYIFTFSKSLFS